MAELKDLIRAALGGEPVEDEQSAYRDNLAIVLCTYFEAHHDCPDDDPQTEQGWSEWATDKTDEALDRLTAAVMRVIADSAGASTE